MTITNKSSRKRPENIDLGNWRVTPHSRWAFHNVRELIPSAVITADKTPKQLPTSHSGIPDALELSGVDEFDLEALLMWCHTDCMVILHRGKNVWQWHAQHCDITRPHIVFSISKSITAMLTGILVGDGVIDTGKQVSHYLSATKGSAYEDCTVQQVLDMTVALAFKEEYLNPDGDFNRYRNATGWNPVDQTQCGPTLEKFLYSIGKAEFEHGEIFNYKSPNTDLLGLLLERTAALPYADLLSSLIWQPLGAETDAYVTVDRALLARAAGGICITVDDLARFGQLVLSGGVYDGQRIIPEGWIRDTVSGGDRNAWLRGDFVRWLPNGRYRNKWYQVGNEDQCYMALGIHGQWLYINPTTSVVIAKVSSQPEPINETIDLRLLEVFEQLSGAFRE